MYTAKEVIKSLQCCDYQTDDMCRACSFRGQDDCTGKLTAAAIEVITNQQDEVDKLHSKVNHYKQYDERRDIDLHSKLIAESRREGIKEFVRAFGQDLKDSSKRYAAIRNITGVTFIDSIYMLLLKKAHEILGEEINI